MADDGMLLNFAVAEDATTSVQRFKGGAWRDRMRAKRGARYGAQKRAETTGVNNVEIGERAVQAKIPPEASSEARPAKRRRENPPTSSQRQSEGRPAGGPREIISSLFSYNPKPSHTIEKTENGAAEEEPSKPTNAPLPDGIDTFTSLGLSPTIAAHLLTKMGLKNPTAIQKAAVSQMLSDQGDAFIQSETGSGKTLAYLLPLVQRIMAMTEKQKDQAVNGQDRAVHRDSGLFAIILAPTRELCKQISVVLDRLLGCAHYIVAGTVIGGEKKKSEKARLRRGINILVATPGRLVDHLENTQVLDVSTVRWLVLDEGDRLMDLGFEEDINKIVQTLDQKKRKSLRAGLPETRTTVLCSATLRMSVQKLGEISLRDAVLIKGDVEEDISNSSETAKKPDSVFLAPAQLKQSYTVVAAKLRLVTLAALLKHTFARKGSVMKAIVFVSCADSVEFHYQAFRRAEAEANPEQAEDTKSTLTLDDAVSSSPQLSSAINPVTLYKLHGSLPQQVRTSTLASFSASSKPSLLIATDVASRGLDLPNLDLVIEYDPPFSAEEHLHRIGRTARLGRDGRAVIFLLPGKEEGYVEVLKSSYRKTDTGLESGSVTQTDATAILRRGFSVPSTASSPSQNNYESLATQFQLAAEQWVLSDPVAKELARKAFQSHVRAYATHVSAERKFFDIKDLHLGHLCKSFGLRDAPGNMNFAGTGRGNKKEARRRSYVHGGGENKANGKIDGAGDGEADEAARKMREKVRKDRKLMMGGGGADEFNIA